MQHDPNHDPSTNDQPYMAIGELDSRILRKLLGRPSGLMTKRRQQVKEEYEAAAKRGEKIRLAEIARRCGLYDYRDARRIIEDLRRMGACR